VIGDCELDWGGCNAGFFSPLIVFPNRVSRVLWGINTRERSFVSFRRGLLQFTERLAEALYVGACLSTGYAIIHAQ
jgi:hypothetical protein